jgi:hypothetical protein
MIRLAGTVAVAVALAAGFVVGHLAGENSVVALPSGGNASAVIHAVERPAECAAPSDVESLKHELTAAIAALQDALASPDAGGSTSRASGGAEEFVFETAESRAADQRLREIVDVAIAAGRWTMDDAEVMRELLDASSPAAAREARLAFARAVNQQRLEVDPHAMRF